MRSRANAYKRINRESRRSIKRLAAPILRETVSVKVGNGFPVSGVGGAQEQLQPYPQGNRTSFGYGITALPGGRGVEGGCRRSGSVY